MNEPPDPPEDPNHTMSSNYTMEDMQKLADELLSDPQLGSHGRVVAACGGDGRPYTGPLPDAPPDLARLDFGYIIEGI